MNALCRLFDRFEEIVIAVFLALATLISFLQVILRYGFSFSLTWASEATTYLLIWTALIGASYGVRKRVHIGVDTVVNMLPQKWYFISVMAASFISLIYTIGITALGAGLISFILSIGIVSPDLELPMWIVYMAVPIGNGLMTVRFVQQIARDIKNPPRKKSRKEMEEIPPLLRKAMREQTLSDGGKI